MCLSFNDLISILLFILNKVILFNHFILSRGQTGLGTTERIQNAPQVVDALEGVKMIGIAAGNWHSAAISGEKTTPIDEFLSGIK